MAISKVTLNGTTLMDATTATAAAADITAPKTAMLADGVVTTGTGSGGSGGGGIPFADYASGVEPSGIVSLKATDDIYGYGISGRRLMTQLTLDLSDGFGINGRYGVAQNTALQRLIVDWGQSASTGLYDYGISENASLTQLIFRGVCLSSNQSGMRNNSALAVVDIQSVTNAIGNNAFYGSTNLKTLILRQSDSLVLVTSSTFANTPFASGKAGGTIYIPNALYTHLGDGTSLDYKAATNWSTWDGYGTVTWAKIEGSAYESLTWWEA